MLNCKLPHFRLSTQALRSVTLSFLIFANLHLTASDVASPAGNSRIFRTGLSYENDGDARFITKGKKLQILVPSIQESKVRKGIFYSKVSLTKAVTP